jgi:signal transduction histidine kinase/CheY-like chemotaxis protein
MSAKPIRAAGAAVAIGGGVVLLGWELNLTAVKSLLAGWRVMVPVSAVLFLLIGLSLLFAARARAARRSVTVARAIAAVAFSIAAVVVIEYLFSLRTGIENWFGVQFDPGSDVAGRMSPLTSLCFAVLSAAIVAATIPAARAHAVARIGSGATLLVAWLAMLAILFDVNRVEDVPRFPGMAVLTIAMMAIASWAALAISVDHIADGSPPRAAAAPRIGLLLLTAFVIPLVLGAVRDLATPGVPAQVVTSLLVLVLSAAMAAIVWQYGARMAALRREREQAFAELERRVAERTHELAARNEELRRSEDRLREADKRKDEFLATLAHELRNPLAPIRSAVAVLRMPHASMEHQLEAGLIIERQVGHMARLIDDLLDVSRITAGKLPLKKTRLRLADVLNLAVSTVRPHIDEAGHQLTMSLPREPIAVEGDEARLSQVFANLLHNACKYTERGGEIMLAVSLPNESEVEVAVRDSGIGIPPEFLPRLFEKFSQVAPALDRSQGGLGLGLSLVQGIVALHLGRVEARSAGTGRGSEFIVRLPVMPLPADIAQLPAGDRASRPLVSRRVLVVDDNRDSAESLALLLRLEGHLVETAHSGEAALDAAARLQPDAILLDLGMPGLNGYDVCERIRAEVWGRSVLMVAQTGWGQAQDRARTEEAGFDAHLTKPIDPDAIHEMLATLRVS